MNRIGHGRYRRLARCLTASSRTQIRPLRLRIAVHDHDIDLGRRVRMPQRRMRDPVHACDFFRVELHFFVQRAAQPTYGIRTRPSAAGSADSPPARNHARKPSLHSPYVPGFAIHFSFGNLRNHRRPAERVGDAPPSQNLSAVDLAANDADPPICLRRRFPCGDRSPPSRMHRRPSCSPSTSLGETPYGSRLLLPLASSSINDSGETSLEARSDRASFRYAPASPPPASSRLLPSSPF